MLKRGGGETGVCMSVGMRNVLAGEARLARVLAVGRAHREREEWARLRIGTIAFGCPVCHNQPRRSSRRDDGSGQGASIVPSLQPVETDASGRPVYVDLQGQADELLSLLRARLLQSEPQASR